jgi:hypothetical protein
MSATGTLSTMGLGSRERGCNTNEENKFFVFRRRDDPPGRLYIDGRRTATKPMRCIVAAHDVPH